MCVGTWQLPFNRKERRTNSVLKGAVHGSPGEGRFRDMSDYFKALLAGTHVVIVNGYL